MASRIHEGLGAGRAGAIRFRGLRSWCIISGFIGLLSAGCAVDVQDGAAQAESALGTTRVYYLAAEEVLWDYAPLGFNGITGEPFDDQANVFVEGNGVDRIGSVYKKAIYREYTDGSFSTLKPRPPEWEHLGVLGPLIRATVGDTIEVHFKNRTTRPISIHPHGVFYDKADEGTPYADDTSGADKADDAVPPGATYVYHWAVPDRAGPGPLDGSSILWMYHSHTDEVSDTYAGLHGPMVITRRGFARRDGTPFDVDREFVTNFEVLDENQSPYLDDNIAQFAPDADPEDEEFGESNLMHSINGNVYGNLAGLEMHRGQHVRWYVMGMGTEVDLHTPHFHGNTVLLNGSRTDVLAVFPATMVTVDMWPDDPGIWLYHCHVNDHILAGMLALYTVE